MPIDTSFLNPIIEAMVASHNQQNQLAQQKYQQQELAQRTKQAGAEQDLRERQLEELQAEHEHQYTLSQKQLDLQKQLQDADLQSKYLQGIGSLNELKKTGVDITPLLQHLGMASSVNQALPDQATATANEASKMKSLVQAQNEGALPSKLQEMAQSNKYETARQSVQNQQQLDILNKQQIFEADQNAKNRANQLDINQLSRNTQLTMNQLDNKTRMMGTDAEYGLDPGASSQIMLDMVTGGTKVDLKNPVMRRLMAAANEQGYKDPGEDVDVLKTLSSTEDALAKYKDFASKLATSKIGAGAQKVGTAIGGNTSDLQNAYDQTKVYLQNIGKNIEGYPGSRQLSSQFGAEVSSVPGPGNTQKQALDKVDNIQDLVNQERNRRTVNYTPQQLEAFKAKNPGINLGPAADKRVQDYRNQQGSGSNRIHYNDLIQNPVPPTTGPVVPPSSQGVPQ